MATTLFLLEVGLHGAVVNILDFDILISSSNSNPAIKFTFGQMSKGKNMNSRYALNCTSAVLLQGYIWH